MSIRRSPAELHAALPGLLLVWVGAGSLKASLHCRVHIPSVYAFRSTALSKTVDILY